MRKATNFKFGKYIHRAHANKSPLKIWETRERGRIQWLPKFLEYPLLSQERVKLRTSNFVGTHVLVYSIGTKPITNFGKSSCGLVRTLEVFRGSGSHILGASRCRLCDSSAFLFLRRRCHCPVAAAISLPTHTPSDVLTRRQLQVCLRYIKRCCYGWITRNERTLKRSGMVLPAWRRHDSCDQRKTGAVNGTSITACSSCPALDRTTSLETKSICWIWRICDMSETTLSNATDSVGSILCLYRPSVDHLRVVYNYFLLSIYLCTKTSTKVLYILFIKTVTILFSVV